MRHMILTFAYLAPLLGGPHLAIADTVTRSSACYSVQDSDTRSACLARAHNDTSRCYSVKRPDLRQQCLSEVRR